MARRQPAASSVAHDGAADANSMQGVVDVAATVEETCSWTSALAALCRIFHMLTSWARPRRGVRSSDLSIVPHLLKGANLLLNPMSIDLD
jgi:hypothetical protein